MKASSCGWARAPSRAERVSVSGAVRQAAALSSIAVRGSVDRMESATAATRRAAVSVWSRALVRCCCQATTPIVSDTASAAESAVTRRRDLRAVRAAARRSLSRTSRAAARKSRSAVFSRLSCPSRRNSSSYRSSRGPRYRVSVSRPSSSQVRVSSESRRW